MMEVKGIKCDNKKCNYDNHDVNFFGSKPKRYEVKMDGTGTTKIEKVPKEEDAKDNK